jgi:hypothetical protein
VKTRFSDRCREGLSLAISLRLLVEVAAVPFVPRVIGGGSVTENYTHTFTEDERKAAEKLGELFGTGWPEGKVISFPNLSQKEEELPEVRPEALVNKVGCGGWDRTHSSSPSELSYFVLPRRSVCLKIERARSHGEY